MEIAKDRNKHPEVFCAVAVLNRFTKFIGKHLYQSFFFNQVARRPKTKRLQQEYFPVNFEKCFREAFCLEI